MIDEIAFERFDRVVEEGRYTAGAWHRRGDDGRHYLCLAAAYGEPGVVKDAASCPVNAFPLWFKELMPTLDDGVSQSDRLWLFKGFAARNRKMATFDAAAWERIRAGFQIACIRSALDAAAKVQPDPAPDYWPAVQAACDQMITALESGDKEKIEKARAAQATQATQATWAAAAAAQATQAAAWAARAAAEAARAAAAAAHRKLAEALFTLIDGER